MVQKIFIKVSILFLALFMVYVAMNFFGSDEFKKNISDIFGGGLKTYSWCPDHALDFQWMDSSISQKWKNASWPSIHRRFCTVTMEPIKNVDLTKISFKPLLKVQSAEAKMAQLEWNPDLSLFQANGMPFYSTSLLREILDK